MPNNKKNQIELSVLSTLRQQPLALGLLVLIIVGTLLGSWTLYHQLQKGAKLTQASQNATAHAQQQLTTTNHYLKQQQQQLLALTEKPLFSDALMAGDPDNIAQGETLLKTSVKNLTQGYLLNRQDTRLTDTHNFVGQELFASVLAGEIPDPVAAHIDGKWQLVFAYPFKSNDGAILGALMAILSTEGLSKQLRNSVNPSLGSTELHQRLSKLKSKPFIQLRSTDKVLEPISLNTQVPHWQLQFTGSSQLVQQTPANNYLHIIFVLMLLVTGLLVSYLLIRLTHKFHRNNPSKKVTLKKRKKKEQHEEPPEHPLAEPEMDTESESYLQIIPSKPKDETVADTTPLPTTPPTSQPGELYPSVVFRDYDIRGIAHEELTPEFANQLGKVLGNKALALGEHALITAADGRNSSPVLSDKLEQGILSTGCNIIHLGQAPTPLLNFATHQLQETDCGVMVTASHNPANYNGFKMFFKRHALCGDEIQALKTELTKEFPEKSSGQLEQRDLTNDYVQAIANDIVPSNGLKVVLDAGNGVAGELAVNVLEAIGCRVMPLYCDIDGNFPNHSPDTSVAANLEDLILCVKEQNADLGIALDGDGDRVVAVSASGKIIWPDELLMIFARDVVSRNPGADVVFDIKSTRRLNSLISSYGGRPVMWKTGHSHMYNKIIECNAPLGGEYSGHIFFHDRWHGFDDGIYAAARLVEIITIREQGLDEIVSSFESSHATTEITIAVDDDKKFTVMDKLINDHGFQDGKISTLDGLRVDFPKAWGLVRASNTSPALTLRFEADSSESLEKIQSLFRKQLLSIDANLTF